MKLSPKDRNRLTNAHKLYSLWDLIKRAPLEDEDGDPRQNSIEEWCQSLLMRINDEIDREEHSID